MNKMIAASAILSLALGTAAYAGSPNRAPSTPATPAPAASSSVPAAPTLTYASESVFAGSSAANPNVPGATGRWIVPGDHSTIAGDALATQMDRVNALGE